MRSNYCITILRIQMMKKISKCCKRNQCNGWKSYERDKELTVERKKIDATGIKAIWHSWDDVASESAVQSKRSNFQSINGNIARIAVQGKAISIMFEDIKVLEKLCCSLAVWSSIFRGSFAIHRYHWNLSNSFNKDKEFAGLHRAEFSSILKL